ncbi:ABC transporter ATP-binding protein [Pararhodobacter sp.]|uniref:ABC transporter ATP-binding protein n=1 Tax=Pararhodobacter sp. TaxID=2127056 RepID=UPI002FDDDCD6
MDRPLEASGLAKRFGPVRAVEGVSLGLDRGQALGLLGPNGAGKSTTLALLTGLRPPDSGRVRIFGHPAGSAAARARMGVTPQAAGFPDQLTPREVLHYAAARRAGLPGVDGVITAFGLERLIDRRMTGFSGGEVRRVALALAFVGQPGLVFLDEPTAGLDSVAQEAFRVVARSYVEGGGAMILTSHHWDEIEAVCDRILMIDQGRPVLEGRLGDLHARMRARRLAFTLPEGLAPPGWLQARKEGGRWQAESDDSDASLRRMVGEGLRFDDLTIEPLALKDIIARIGQENRV